MLKLLISDYEIALETGAGQGGVVTEDKEEWEDDKDVSISYTTLKCDA